MTSRSASTRPRRGAAAFTLVELLVVIGIIAVLISILLPTLRGVRRQANLVQCSSNMKQIATAMIMYIQDNKGRHPPAAVEAAATAVSPVYPRGWWFANELVRQNYIKTQSINVYPHAGLEPERQALQPRQPVPLPGRRRRGLGEERQPDRRGGRLSDAHRQQRVRDHQRQARRRTRAGRFRRGTCSTRAWSTPAAARAFSAG